MSEGQQRSWIIAAAASAAVAAGAWAVWKSRRSRQGSSTLANFFSRGMRISVVPLVSARRRDAAVLGGKVLRVGDVIRYSV